MREPTDRERILARALRVALRYTYSRSIKNDAIGKTRPHDDPAYKRDVEAMYAGVVIAEEVGEKIE